MQTMNETFLSVCIYQRTFPEAILKKSKIREKTGKMHCFQFFSLFFHRFLIEIIKIVEKTTKILQKSKKLRKKHEFHNDCIML